MSDFRRWAEHQQRFVDSGGSGEGALVQFERQVTVNWEEVPDIRSPFGIAGPLALLNLLPMVWRLMRRIQTGVNVTVRGASDEVLVRFPVHLDRTKLRGGGTVRGTLLVSNLHFQNFVAVIDSQIVSPMWPVATRWERGAPTDSRGS